MVVTQNPGGTGNCAPVSSPRLAALPPTSASMSRFSALKGRTKSVDSYCSLLFCSSCGRLMLFSPFSPSFGKQDHASYDICLLIRWEVFHNLYLNVGTQ